MSYSNLTDFDARSHRADLVREAAAVRSSRTGRKARRALKRAA